MKKILAVLLAVVMIAGILPVAVFAANEPTAIYADTYMSSSSVSLIGGDYFIPAGETVEISEDRYWTVEQGTTLFVYGNLDIKGTLNVKGYVTALESGKVTAKCWDEGGAFLYGTVLNSKNVCGNETETAKRYFAEVYVPATRLYDGLADAAHLLQVKYLTSRTGSANDYLYSDLYFDSLESANNVTVTAPKWSFQNVYTSPDYNSATGMLTVPLNQYLFLHFDFLTNNKPSKKYDGNRMAIRFNGFNVYCEQGVCAREITSGGAVEFRVGSDINNDHSANWYAMEPFLLRQERIYIPSGEGYSAYGINGEASAADQTVRLNYGDEFKFRVKVDSKYSDSVCSVYLVKGYQWDSRNYEDTMDALLEEVYLDENGVPQNFVWKFEDYKPGEQQKIYVDQYGIYHISSVEDEYTIVVSGVISNDTLSIAGGFMDTIRNLLNSLKQFFERVKQMLGL